MAVIRKVFSFFSLFLSDVKEGEFESSEVSPTYPVRELWLPYVLWKLLRALTYRFMLVAELQIQGVLARICVSRSSGRLNEQGTCEKLLNSRE